MATRSQVYSCIWAVIVATKGMSMESSLEIKRFGPVFISEPPSHLSFLNTSGAAVDCLAYGSPSPKVSWRLREGPPAEDVSGLRQTLANGTLVLWPFRPERYRQDIHSTVYVCQATSDVGTILSRGVHVRGVVKQYYDAQVYDEFVLDGNTAVLRCHIPSFVKDYVSVTSWIRDDVITITSTAEEGGRFSVFSTGELHIRNATPSDSSISYRCQTTHHLTHEVRINAASGRLIVTSSSGTMSPRITDAWTTLSVFQGETVEIPCAAQGFPVPRYSWLSYNANSSQLMPVHLDSRMSQLSGSLLIREVSLEDSGKYVCSVTNSAGEEKKEAVLTVAAHLSAQLKPPHQVVDVGKEATFNCSCTGHPIVGVAWLKDGHSLVVDGVRLKMTSWVHLSINPVRREDGGMYQCVVSNDYESAQGSAQLSLGDAEPVFHWAFSEETLKPGPFVSLKCIASGNPVPQVLWTLDGDILPDDPRFRVGDYVTETAQVLSYVNISSLRSEDGGEYACTARSPVGSVQHSRRLDVYGVPFIRPMKDVTAVAGQALALRCHVAGYPIDNISWSRGKNRLPINRRQEVFGNGTLMIQDIQREVDDGQYTCRAWNAQGQSATGQVRVKVMVKPVIEPFAFPKHLQEGMRARLVCTVIQGDPPFLIGWQKDSHPIDSNLGVVIRNEDFSSDLTFSSVIPTHNGNYTCTVANSASAVTHTAALVVDVPPRWQVEPRDREVVAGHNVLVDCLAEGFPPPVITWERGSTSAPRLYTVIASGPRYEVYANGSLLVKAAQEQDGGYYLCQASNGIGSGLSKVIFLTVHVAPRFDTKFRSETVHKGDATRLTCRAVGDHPMTILWNVDKQPLNPAQDPRYELKEDVGSKWMLSEITILSAERRDSALFTCLVSNAFGRDDLNIRLIVQEPPEPPRELRVLEHKSQSVRLTWALPYNGNSAILKYFISCNVEASEKDENEEEKRVKISVRSEESTVIVGGLQPAQSYSCSVQAENSVGMGEPSQHVLVTTAEEVPGGPPLNVQAEAIDSQSVRVFWKPPERFLWNGPIRGYYIGYRIHDSNDAYLYKTLDMGSENKREEVVLTQLHKFSSYSVLVQAYNSQGAGPRSDEIVVRTTEDVPSQAPTNVRCSPVNPQTLHLIWEPPPVASIHGVLTGYKVFFRKSQEQTADYSEKEVLAQEVKLLNLEKYVNYTVLISASTKRGHGLHSQAVHCRTAEDVPDPPADIKAVAISSDGILVSWKAPSHPNGLLTRYTLYWRSSINGFKNATVVHISPAQMQHKVAGLVENSRHEFWLTASTSAGEGETTRVISQTTSRRVPARAVSFGERLSLVVGEKVLLTCQAVGVPSPTREWKLRGQTLKKSEKVDILSEGTLVLRKLQMSDEGNYTCHLQNRHGADEITYVLAIQAQTHRRSLVKVESVTADSVRLELPWSLEDKQTVQSYELHYKVEQRSTGWRQRRVGGRETSVILDGLECGTTYQIYAVAFLAEGLAERGDAITFRTHGTAPVAPKKEDLFIGSNGTYVSLQMGAWQSGGCPIVQLLVEYRALGQSYYTRLTPLVPPLGVFAIGELSADSRYSLKLTAHNSAGMAIAEYEMPVSGGVAPPTSSENLPLPSSTSFFEDTTTLVSMASSGVVLIAGVVAVVCLVMYKRRRNTRPFVGPTHRTYRGESSSRSDVATTTSLMANLEKKSSRSETSRHSRDLPSSYFSSPTRKVAPTNTTTTTPTGKSSNPSQAITSSPPKSANRRVSQTDYEEEITPYATFRLPDTAAEDNTCSEELKTFSLHHGEPSYMLKTSLDPPSSSKSEKEELYHSQAPNSHSLTSGSSNQDELMRAYEYARRNPPPPILPLHYNGGGDTNQSRNNQSSRAESDATDPGIRQFSGSPPRPNERRQGACLTPGVTPASSSKARESSESSSSTTSEESTPVNTPSQFRGLPFHSSSSSGVVQRTSRSSWGALARSRLAPQAKRGPSAKGIKKGLSSDESDSEGTLYTFSCTGDNPVPKRGSSGQEQSETECDRLTRISRGFPRRPPLRTGTKKTDIIDC